MRVTGGLYRGRKIVCPPGVIRPAMDRMRESMFSILGNQEGTAWLDLFSGSGSIGIEAASRGAGLVHLVERDWGKKETIMKNIAFVETSIKLFISDVFRFLMQAKIAYDVVYADPPFPMEEKIRLLEAVERNKILKAEGLFIIHYPVEEKAQWPEQLGDLLFIDERSYGRSTLRFYKRKKKMNHNDPVAISAENIASLRFTTYSFETDSLGAAQTAFYLRIVQEAAGLHAAMRGCSIMDLHAEGKTWVITRNRIEIFGYTRWNEQIHVNTWAQEPIRLHLPRIVEGHASDGSPLFQAKTFWAVIDLKNSRPLRPQEMNERIGLLKDPSRAIDMNLPKSTVDFETLHQLGSYAPRVTYLDTDRNQHINNVSYLSWVLEALPAEFRTTYKVKSADVLYQKQTFLDDLLFVHTYAADEEGYNEETPSLVSTIVRKTADGAEEIVFTAHTEWKKRSEF